MAGPPGMTVDSIAPPLPGSPIACATSLLIASRSTRMPMTPRVTLPLRNCGSRSRIGLIGVAKPIPMLAARCESV